MSGSKRPSTSSLRRFISSRPFVTVAELRRRFGLDDPDAMAHLARDGVSAWVGLPEREAAKLQELWDRNELGVELSVEVRAPVVVGVYPMRIARYVMDGGPGPNGNGSGNGPVAGATVLNGGGVTGTDLGNGTNGYRSPAGFHRRPWATGSTGAAQPFDPGRPREHRHAPRPMSGAPSYGSEGGGSSSSDDSPRA